tara:strand:- start:643 stop:780 length:138 start_codon:yes stop_codon:yes gene_type:complete
MVSTRRKRAQREEEVLETVDDAGGLKSDFENKIDEDDAFPAEDFD